MNVISESLRTVNNDYEIEGQYHFVPNNAIPFLQLCSEVESV